MNVPCVSDCCRRRLSATLLLAGLVGAAHAHNESDNNSVDSGGNLKLFLYDNAHQPDHWERIGSKLSFNLKAQPATNSKVVADLSVEFDLIADRSELIGNELYIELDGEQWELRAGQQYIFWGRTFWVNPTDVLTAWDYTRMSGDLTDYRMAPWAVRNRWYFQAELSLDLVWLPVFSANVGSDQIPASLGSLPVTTQTADKPQAGEWGLRLSQAVSDWALDWSLSLYQGYSKNPQPQITPQFDQGQVNGFSWLNKYQPITLAGTDFSKSLGPWLITGEAAFVRGNDTDGSDPLLPNDHVQAVIGLSHLWGNGFNLGVQAIQQRLLDYDRATEATALAATGQQAPYTVDRRISLVLSYSNELHWGAQTLTLYHLDYRDYFNLSYIWWQIADATRLTLGSVLFDGEKEDTPYGRQRQASRYFVELVSHF